MWVPADRLRVPGHLGEQQFWRGVVLKGLAHVRVETHVAGGEHKAPAQLERILAESVLPVSGSQGSLPARRIVATEQVQQRRLPKADGAVGLSLLIDQQREGDADLFTEVARVGPIPEPDGGEARPRVLELRLVFAQLRDVLAAEDSAVVAQKHQYRRAVLPQRAQSERLPIGIREADLGQRCAQRTFHSSDDTTSGCLFGKIARRASCLSIHSNPTF